MLIRSILRAATIPSDSSMDSAGSLSVAVRARLFQGGARRPELAELHAVFERSKSAISLLSSSANAEPKFPGLLAEVLGDRYSPVQWMGYAR